MTPANRSGAPSSSPQLARAWEPTPPTRATGNSNRLQCSIPALERSAPESNIGSLRVRECCTPAPSVVLEHRVHLLSPQRFATCLIGSPLATPLESNTIQNQKGGGGALQSTARPKSSHHIRGIAMLRIHRLIHRPHRIGIHLARQRRRRRSNPRPAPQSRIPHQRNSLVRRKIVPVIRQHRQTKFANLPVGRIGRDHVYLMTFSARYSRPRSMVRGGPANLRP